MKATNRTSVTRNFSSKTPAEGEMVEVLYQKMGDRWFAFSLIGDEVFVGSLTPEEIHAAERGEVRQKVYKVSGNS